MTEARREPDVLNFPDQSTGVYSIDVMQACGHVVTISSTDKQECIEATHVASECDCLSCLESADYSPGYDPS